MCRTWWIVIGCVALLPATGCVTLPGPDVLPEDFAARKGDAGALPGAVTAKVCLAMAEYLEADGRDAEAVPLYEKARLTDPALTRAAHRLAVLYDRQGKFDKARQEFQALLRQRPEDADLRCDYGCCLYGHGRWDDAEQQLRLALSYTAKNDRAWVHLGLTLGQKGDYESSLAAFEKAVGKAKALGQLAALLEGQGKHSAARMACEAALALEPGLSVAQVALTRLNNPEATAATVRTSEKRLETLPTVPRTMPPADAGPDAPPHPAPRLPPLRFVSDEDAGS